MSSQPSTQAARLSQLGLARYLYVASLVRGRRVLEIGGGDGQGALLLSERGARSVLVLDVDGAPSGSKALGKPGKEVSLRAVSRAELLRPEGLRTAISGSFDVIFLHATPELCAQPFLSELRRLLVSGGYLIAAARSKESSATAPDAIAYFDLFDSLAQAGFGPVTMLGQSPFYGAAVVPFGSSEPPLFFDDTLSPPEHPDEYVALCGPPPGGALPYQVVKLPRPAAEKSAPVEKRVEVQVADPQVAAECEKWKTKAETLAAELEKHKQESQMARAEKRGLEERLQAKLTEEESRKAELGRLTQLVDETTAALRNAESQRSEASERLQQRDRGESEASQAAVLHERQMRELRSALEERDAFVSELEEQARELPKMQERLAAAEKLCEETQRSERQFRQRLAEVEGQLLRARHEIKERERPAAVSADLEQRTRDIEASRRELVMQRVEFEQAEQALKDQRAAFEKQAEEFARAKAAHAEEPALREKLEKERALGEKAISERDAALSEVRRELLLAQERLQQLHAELEQRTRSLKDAQTELEELRGRSAMTPQKTERTMVLAAPTLGSGRRVDSDGVPLLVGDMPTAPVPFGEGQPSPQQEISQLRQRIAELIAENDRLKDKITEAERETWKHMKARSEAEQNAAEVREDTVRKLRDARKLASVELTRAMEDATKKAVQLREELGRAEAERKEALAQIKELRTARDVAAEQVAAARQELDSLRKGSENLAPESRPGEQAAVQSELVAERTARQAAQQAADEAQVRVAELRSAVMALEQAMAETRQRLEQEQRRAESLEEELQKGGGARQGGANAVELRLQQELQQQGRFLSERTQERDALARLLAEVEREAAARSERARAMRVRLSEREREVEALRAELADRERKISALEQKLPPSEEVARLEGDLQSTRRRITELLEETARSEHHGDDAVATALRERARAVRTSESLEQASRERDEARSRVAELEQRIKEAEADADRARSELLRQEKSSDFAPNSVGTGDDR